MYDATADAYCYPDTTILKNRLGLTSQQALDAFELEASTQRASESLPVGRLSVRHYLAIHHHLFQDVYVWAGRTRTVRISKDGSMFCYPEHVQAQLRGLFGILRKVAFLRVLPRAIFMAKAAHFLAELNAIHPFREGNGRTQLAFLTLLAAQAGYPLDIESLDPGEMLEAMIASFGGGEERLREALSRLTPSRA